MKNSANLALIGVFYDGYYDVWEDFLELKELFWKDCPYPLYIVNQSKNLSFSKEYDARVIHAGIDAEYSKKVRTAVEKIDADYVLLLLEDFFMSHEVIGGIFDKIVTFMRSNNIKYYSMPLSEFMVVGEGEKYNGIDYLFQIAPTKEYTLNCQPAIWEKEFLLNSIGYGNYNAWIFEGIYIKSPKAHSEEFLKQCLIDTRNILGLKHGVLQGCIFPDIVKFYKKLGYELKNKRPVLPLSIRIKRWIRFKLPQSIIRKMKIKLKGQTVVSKYSNEIDIQLKAMGLE